MSAFHDVQFPFPVGLGASGGPVRTTEIVALASGYEERNTPHAHSKRRYDAGPGVKSLDDLAGLIAFFEARRGQLHAFRFRDPADHKSCLPSHEPGPGDQLIAAGDGETRVFALTKLYGTRPDAYRRPIRLPRADSVLAAVEGEIRLVTLDELGRIEFSSAPEPGAQITAGFIFDVPVRFDTDRIDASMEAFEAGLVPQIPLAEVWLSPGSVAP
ncbi:DUF2460 domain-containing protein [Marinicauda sp. Alg238-R41]|uniref:DUF2460 domain-containing protein n=1 Tax=Marinicauda sp. Alg238-R41 TaxID=2993447 RepID=UPI0022E1A118|nr:DUF2460 domain-containing protein [Marinicauda sp. Alg238-R41]